MSGISDPDLLVFLTMKDNLINILHSLASPLTSLFKFQCWFDKDSFSDNKINELIKKPLVSNILLHLIIGLLSVKTGMKAVVYDDHQFSHHPSSHSSYHPTTESWSLSQQTPGGRHEYTLEMSPFQKREAKNTSAVSFKGKYHRKIFDTDVPVVDDFEENLELKEVLMIPTCHIPKFHSCYDLFCELSIKCLHQFPLRNVMLKLTYNLHIKKVQTLYSSFHRETMCICCIISVKMMYIYSDGAVTSLIVPCAFIGWREQDL